jgi:hypothetical protein
VASPLAGSPPSPSLSQFLPLPLVSLIRFWQGKERRKKNAKKIKEKEGKRRREKHGSCGCVCVIKGETNQELKYTKKKKV